MVQRDDVSHRTHAQPPGAQACADRIQARRGHPAFVGTEMVLDTKSIIEAELVTQLKLPPQLFIALMRRHSGLCPDVGKMGKLHRRPFKSGNSSKSFG